MNPAASTPTPPRQHRFEAALGLFRALDKGTYTITGRGNALIVRADMDREAFDAALPQYTAGAAFAALPAATQDDLFGDYIHPMLDLAFELGYDKPFLVWPGDNSSSIFEPVFVRARAVRHPGLGVTERFRSVNHTPKTLAMTENDKPFEEKKERLVWRGVTTGRFQSKQGQLSFSTRYYVADALARNKHPDIDIGYSGIVQKELMSQETLDASRAAIRPRLSWEEMLDARYVLSLEGNDVATGLPWALHSNSCVLMPTPTCESWYCEQMLKPFVHYVPIRPDLANLRQMFGWCQRHTVLCAKIAAAGREFIAPFFKDDSEHDLALDIAKAFFGKVTIVPAAGAQVPADLF